MISAERAAWDFISDEGGQMELATINPTAVMGPALGPDTSHSLMMLKGMIEGQHRQPRVQSCFVDVRDVADLRLRAMTDPAAAGERFPAASGDALWLVDAARILKERLGDASAKGIHQRGVGRGHEGRGQDRPQGESASSAAWHRSVGERRQG